MRAITLLSDASLPMLMLVLGMQLQAAKRPEHPAAVASRGGTVPCRVAGPGVRGGAAR